MNCGGSRAILSAQLRERYPYLAVHKGCTRVLYESAFPWDETVSDSAFVRDVPPIYEWLARFQGAVLLDLVIAWLLAHERSCGHSPLTAASRVFGHLACASRRLQARYPEQVLTIAALHGDRHSYMWRRKFSLDFTTHFPVLIGVFPMSSELQWDWAAGLYDRNMLRCLPLACTALWCLMRGRASTLQAIAMTCHFAAELVRQLRKVTDSDRVFDVPVQLMVTQYLSIFLRDPARVSVRADSALILAAYAVFRTWKRLGFSLYDEPKILWANHR